MYNQQSSVTRTVVSCSIVFACIATLVCVGVPVVSADAPEDPVTFYGHAADESGDPLEPETEIVAVSDSGGEASTKVEDSGCYNDLIVPASTGDEITFYQEYSDGPQAIESFTVGDNSMYEQDLTFVEVDDIYIELETHETTVATSVELSVIGVCDDGSETDITKDANLDSLNPDVAELHGDRIATRDPGEATISATYTDSHDNEYSTVADLHVIDKLDDIQVDVQTKSPIVGDSPEVTITAEYRSGSHQVVTENANITSHNKNAIVAAESSLNAQSAGSAKITFSYADTGIRISDSINITVEERTPTDLAVDLKPSELKPDQTAEISATALFDEAQDADVTSHESTSIETSDPSIVSVDGTTITAQAGGTATLSVTYSEGGVKQTESTTVTVEPVLTDLYFSDAPETMVPDATDEIGLTAVYSDGSSHDVTSDETTDYTVANDSVGTISDGTFTAEHPGTTTIAVTYTKQDTTLTESTTIDVLDTTKDIQHSVYSNYSAVPESTITDAERAVFTYDSVSDESTAAFSSSMLAASVTTGEDVTEQSLYAGNLSTVPEQVSDPDGTVLATTELIAENEQVGTVDVQLFDLFDQYTANVSDPLQLIHHDGTQETIHNITTDTETLTTSDAQTTVTTDLTSPSVFVLAEPAVEDEPSSPDDTSDPSPEEPDRNGEDDDDNTFGLILLVTTVGGGTLGIIAIGLLYIYRDDDSEAESQNDVAETDTVSTAHSDADAENSPVSDSVDGSADDNVDDESGSGSLFRG
ncbi:hypothetical protein K0C01_02995 [Salinarchaeum sp. IM2453]|uniref:Ig-like domain-containing protein n=1 Tax=Salinarchaeum sp. IM2453 TaxID=2862870 RepID=UPI001C83C377|nr:hypothetical protein [Salinarchaeum sp. IM2453]QZA89135.1 hypothetical protein K0C01_02995 [Salinarchaeum sp. IM2453]